MLQLLRKVKTLELNCVHATASPVPASFVLFRFPSTTSFRFSSSVFLTIFRFVLHANSIVFSSFRLAFHFVLRKQCVNELLARTVHGPRGTLFGWVISCALSTHTVELAALLKEQDPLALYLAQTSLSHDLILLFFGAKLPDMTLVWGRCFRE